MLIFVQGPIIGGSPDQVRPQDRVPEGKCGIATSARVPTSAGMVSRGKTEGGPRLKARSSGEDNCDEDHVNPRTD